MKKQILLIRHGKTKGNLEGRYIGSKTDEDLCSEGIAELSQAKEIYDKLLGESDLIYSSPMKRALQTSEILFEGRRVIEISELTEIDFGAFENKNYHELNGNADYQSWIDSGGSSDYPKGERLCDFKERSMRGFVKILLDTQSRDFDRAAVVCHGGNIMSVMSALTGNNYYDFQIENAKGFWLELEVKDKEVDLLSYNRL